MLINFWYPLARSAELDDAPLKVRALRHDLVLFRDSADDAHCLADICAHRNGSLSGGRVHGDCIQCPYHGWRYDGGGRCRRIPTLPEGAAIPESARVDAYPVDERYGLIFVFLGDAPEPERPPILEAPEWEADGWTTITMEYLWHAHYERVMENGIDATHAEFSHEDASSMAGDFQRGGDTRYTLVDPTNDWDGGYTIDNPDLTLTQGYLGAVQGWAHMNFMMGKERGDFRFYYYVTPIDETVCRRYLLHARNFQHGEKMDTALTETNWKFEKEDRDLLEAMRPIVPPRGHTHDLLQPEEQAMARYRKHLRQWENRGWRIDTGALDRRGAEQASAIPSPARRGGGYWVLPVVPLLTGVRHQ
jgi:phenylpropionate dioxygenase-like ring-hydroxylating dioxygenase large terminal subunit